jgi:predicted transcriptional regulator
MGAKHLPEKTRQLAISMREEGYGPQRIATILDLNASTVSKIYTRHKMSLNQSAPQPAPTQPVQPDTDWHKEWVELLNENVRLKDDLDILKKLIRHTFADKV